MPVMAFRVELVTAPLRKKSDQMDYQRRIFAWFGHYLKDEPAPTWITNGESYLEHQREQKKIKAENGKSQTAPGAILTQSAQK